MNRRQNGHYREARFPAIPDRKSKKFISIPAENGAELISEIIDSKILMKKTAKMPSHSNIVTQSQKVTRIWTLLLKQISWIRR